MSTANEGASPNLEGSESRIDLAAPTAGSSLDGAAPLLDRAGQALFQLGRLFSRRPLGELLAQRNGRSTELSRILVVQAVETGPESPGQDVTVGLVAQRLAVDPSTASRLVAETVRDGYLTRTASPADGRRVPLTVTAAGHALADQARRFQRAVFEQVTRDWSARERREFARLFVQFAEAMTKTVTDPPASQTPPGQ